MRGPPPSPCIGRARYGLCLYRTEQCLPEPLPVRGSECVDEHERAIRIHRELLFPVDVDQPAPADLVVQPLIDSENGFEEFAVLTCSEARDSNRLIACELAIDFLEFCFGLEERFRQGLSILRCMTFGES